MAKISQLPTLINVNTGSIIPIVDDSQTQKITIGKLFEFLSGSLDQTFATEVELLRSASSITSSFNEFASASTLSIAEKLTTSSFESLTASFNSFSSSVNTSTASLNSYTASNDSLNNTQNDRLNELQSTSASLNSYTSSNDNKWGTLGALTGSLAITGSNIFSGNQTISGSVNVSGSLNLNDITINENTISVDTGKNLIIQTSYSGTIIGTATETATDSQGGQDTITFAAWIEGSGGTDYPSIVNVQPNWKASGPGLSVGATVASVNTLVFSPGQSVYQITLNSGYGLFQTSETYTFTEPDASGTITKNWVFESGSNLIIPNGGDIIGAGNLVTTSSFNSFTSSYQIDSSSFDSRITSASIGQDLSVYLSASVFNNLSGSFATTGSNTFVGDQTITGSLKIQGIGGDEGGEIQLGLAQTNTTLSGSIVFDVYTDRLRLFEGGGNNRGAFLNVASQSNSVSSEIVTSTTVSKIETISSASYAALTPPVSGTLYIII